MKNRARIIGVMMLTLIATSEVRAQVSPRSTTIGVHMAFDVSDGRVEEERVGVQAHLPIAGSFEFVPQVSYFLSLLDIETAQSMLAWPHSGFHVHDGVWVAADDRDFTVRLARYCARNPVALGRMEYQEQDGSVTYHSDKPSGPTAGSEDYRAPRVPRSTDQPYSQQRPGTAALLRLLRVSREGHASPGGRRRTATRHGRPGARGLTRGKATLGRVTAENSRS